MKLQTTKIGKVPFTVSVPETIEEHGQCHGRATATLEKAVNYDVAHTLLSKIRSKAGEALEALGAERDIASTKDDGTKVFKAIDTKWIERSFIALDMDLKAQTEFYQSISDELGYDMTATRGTNSGFNAVDLKDAKSVIEAITLGKTSFERIKTNLESRNPGLTLSLTEDGTCDAETLALALKIERTRVEAERTADLYA